MKRLALVVTFARQYYSFTAGQILDVFQEKGGGGGARNSTFTRDVVHLTTNTKIYFAYRYYLKFESAVGFKNNRFRMIKRKSEGFW